MDIKEFQKIDNKLWVYHGPVAIITKNGEVFLSRRYNGSNRSRWVDNDYYKIPVVYAEFEFWESEGYFKITINKIKNIIKIKNKEYWLKRESG